MRSSGPGGPHKTPGPPPLPAHKFKPKPEMSDATLAPVKELVAPAANAERTPGPSAFAEVDAAAEAEAIAEADAAAEAEAVAEAEAAANAIAKAEAEARGKAEAMAAAEAKKVIDA